ncbi:hypothetical protein INR49_012208 [Caranx melampygus]|nr:hypothetical protein INR49_012208 [Caranx melampygus]
MEDCQNKANSWSLFCLNQDLKKWCGADMGLVGYEEFTPDITDEDNNESYSFQCSCPGLYQCRVTGLLFDMEREGLVVYSIVPGTGGYWLNTTRNLQDPCLTSNVPSSLCVSFTSHTVRSAPQEDVALEKIIKHITLVLKDTNSSHCVWERRICLSLSGVKSSRETSPLNLPSNKKLLNTRSSFIDAISEPVLKSLLDHLLERKVMTDSEVESVDKMMNRGDKARLVIDTVRKKGEAASSEMIEFLCKVDPFLCEHLGLVLPLKHRNREARGQDLSPAFEPPPELSAELEAGGGGRTSLLRRCRDERTKGTYPHVPVTGPPPQP